MQRNKHLWKLKQIERMLGTSDGYRIGSYYRNSGIPLHYFTIDILLRKERANESTPAVGVTWRFKSISFNNGPYISINKLMKHKYDRQERTLKTPEDSQSARPGG
jgi:hypothetical protein